MTQLQDNPATGAGDERGAAGADALKVFISYSRRDMAAADAMVADLERNGFAVTIDRRDLPYGEEWQKELAGFIAASDTVVWLVSPDSVKSKWVNWELGEVGRLAKRLLPVRVREVDPGTLPEALGRIHLLPAQGAYDPALHEKALVKALNTDQAWLKKATSLSDGAREWTAKGRDSALLLRGRALTEAEAWSLRTPADAPAPSSEVLELILASRRGQRNRLRYTVIGSIAAAIVAIGLAGLAVWFGIEAGEQAVEAARQRQVAEENEKRAIEQAEIARQREATAIENETVSLVALSRVALGDERPTDAVKLSLAAWPRKGSEARPRLQRNAAGLAEALPLLTERSTIFAESSVLSAMFSPDGKRILTSSAGKIRVWDRSTDTLLLELGLPDNRIGFAVFSPDGQRIAASSTDNTVRMWEAGTGKPLMTFKGHGDQVNAIAFSPDGTRLVTGSSDLTARVWDAATGAQLLVLGGHEQLLRAVAFSPDGTRIVTGARDKTARIWNAKTGAQLRVLSPEANNGIVFAASFSPDGTQILTSSFERDKESFAIESNLARIWNAETGEMLLAVTGHSDFVGSAVFSPDASLVATSSWDKTVRVWLASTGAQLMILNGHDAQVSSASFSPDGTHLITASADGTARLWRVRADPGRLLAEGADIVAEASFSPDGRRVVAGLGDKTARIWRTADGTPLAILFGHTGSIISASFSPDGRRVVTSAADKTARIWDPERGVELLCLPHSDTVSIAEFSADGSRILTIAGYQAHVWSASDGKLLFEVGDEQHQVRTAAYSTDGSRFVTTSFDGSPRLWNAESGTSLYVLDGHSEDVSLFAFSPDGSRLVTASLDSLRVWDVPTGKQQIVMPDQTGVLSSVRFSPDGTRIIIASSDKTARIINASDGALLATLQGHGNLVRSAVFSPDGMRAATVSGAIVRRGEQPEYSVRIWDVATGMQLLLVGNHPDAISSAEFTVDGKHLLTGSNASLRLWDLGGLEAGDAFQVACQRLGNNISLTDVQKRYGLGELTPICGDNAPLPMDRSKLK